MTGRVLLIVHDNYQDDNDFPLGPAYLAAALKREAIDVEVYCQDVFHYPNSHLAELLESEHFDLIGLGFMAARFKETVEPLCRIINQHKKDAWLVLGGYGPSPIPEYMLQETRADVIAIGEAEKIIIDLVNCKINKSNLAGVNNIAYRDGDEIHVNERKKLIASLDSIPFPAWELFPMDKYTTCQIYPGQEKTERSLAMISTRGCIARCSFCYRMEKGVRRRSLDNVIEEIKTLMSRYNITYFFIADELTFFKKDKVLEFEEALKKSGMKIKYHCELRANLVDEEVVESLQRSGCRFVNIGFESMDQKVLDRMSKGTTVEDNIRAAEICNKAGLTMGLNVIWGNPYDTEASLWQLVDFTKKYNTYGQLRTIRPITPYPGCPLYYDAIQMGLLKGPDDFFEKFKNSDLITVNYTDIPTDECHSLLFAANTELILDHFLKTNDDMREAKRMIDAFYGLYFEKDYKFRGARHYDCQTEGGE